jgi:hypothetical protein
MEISLTNCKAIRIAMREILLTLVLTGLAMMSLNAIPPHNESDYTLVRTEKNIALSSRDIKLPANYSVRELRAEFMVAGNAATLLQVLRDEKYTMQWMKGVKEFSVISRNNENEWIAYVQYQIPWPLRNQDCVIRYQCKSVENGDGFVLNLNSVADYLPENIGIERITHMSSRWAITQCNNNMCMVEYTVCSEQKPRYPRWAIDPVIQNNLIGTLASLRELAEKFKT